MRGDFLSIVKTKLRSCVQAMNDCKDEVSEGEHVFQIDELVDSYWVALSTKLKDNTYVDMDELNAVLSTGGHTNIDKDERIK